MEPKSITNGSNCAASITGYLWSMLRDKSISKRIKYELFTAIHRAHQEYPISSSEKWIKEWEEEFSDLLPKLMQQEGAVL